MKMEVVIICFALSFIYLLGQNSADNDNDTSELQDRGISDGGAPVDEGPSMEQEDEHVGPRPNPGDAQGGDHHHDGAQDGPGEEDRGAVRGEGGAVLHPGRERRQDRHAGKGSQGARLLGE